MPGGRPAPRRAGRACGAVRPGASRRGS